MFLLRFLRKRESCHLKSSQTFVVECKTNVWYNVDMLNGEGKDVKCGDVVMRSMTPKELAIQALENMRGDDLYRAMLAFRGMTPQQMQEKHGRSGKTRAQVLADCHAHEDRVNAAIAWVRAAYVDQGCDGVER